MGQTEAEIVEAAMQAEPQSVISSVRALLANAIDYAGLFPPAKLDMQLTVQNYAKYLHSDDEWLLGRLIVPVARLEEFEQHADALLARDENSIPWEISALTKPADDDALAGDFERIAAFNEKHAEEANGLAAIDVIELKGQTVDAIDSALDIMPDDLFPFFELPIEEDPRGLIATLVGADAGAKVRTGGVTADLHPQPLHLARLIAACATADVPFKATAGLHHPFRHFAEAVQAKQFGFFNVFICACLAAQDAFTIEELTEILEDGQSGSFVFDDTGLAWRDNRLSLEEIEFLHSDLVISFGSCSFDEPLADLRNLGLVE